MCRQNHVRTCILKLNTKLDFVVMLNPTKKPVFIRDL
jgi:hypothetical protein